MPLAPPRPALIGLVAVCLLGCATPPVEPPAPSIVPANLLHPCPLFEPPPLDTNYDLLMAYLSAVGWGADCRQRHIELTNAIDPPAP